MQIKSNFQLYKRKEYKRLTLTGWGLLITCIAIFCSLSLQNAFSFLEIANTIESKLLGIERHVPDYALDNAKIFSIQNQDSLIFTTGVTMTQGSNLCGYSNYSDLKAATLYGLGINSSLIISNPSNPKQKDRTFESVLALKHQFRKMNITKGSLNILTLDTYTRLTRYLFWKAMGKNLKIGIISVHAINYDTTKWWTSVFGVRAVIYEGLAWL
ncbi:MAG: hypothetical protein ACOYO1_02895 [Bacteroidales bacterium]